MCGACTARAHVPLQAQTPLHPPSMQRAGALAGKMCSGARTWHSGRGTLAQWQRDRCTVVEGHLHIGRRTVAQWGQRAPGTMGRAGGRGRCSVRTSAHHPTRKGRMQTQPAAGC